MKCPNCGADMEDGKLYCETCGEDIHMVPDFEPEVEQNIEETISGIVEELKEEEESQSPERDGASGSGEEAHDRVVRIGRAVRWLAVYTAVVVLTAVVVFLIVYNVQKKHSSLEYQLEKAREAVQEENYDKAISYYESALELAPDDVELAFEVAEVYFVKNNKIEYEYQLRRITADSNATTDQLERAYGKLIAIYRARDDYESINSLLLASNNDTIISIYQSYVAREPEFGIEPGYYEEMQPLKLTAFGTGKIYYTLDGSEPTEESERYTAPILLDEGTIVVKAVFINENGVRSPVVTKEYEIAMGSLMMPEITPASGTYDYPIQLFVEEADGEVYYTLNGGKPTEKSTLYVEPIPVPVGNSVFQLVRIHEGKMSEVVTCTYTVELQTNYRPEEAVADVVMYLVSTGKLTGLDGHFDDSKAVYRYMYQWPRRIEGKGDFYIIYEEFQDEAGDISRTGNNFAVNIYTHEIKLLRLDRLHNYRVEDLPDRTPAPGQTEGAEQTPGQPGGAE